MLPQPACNLPADTSVRENNAPDVARGCRQVPDLHDLVEAGGAEPGRIGREAQGFDGRGVAAGVEPQPEIVFRPLANADKVSRSA